jgi:hypothetical protein
VPSVRKSKVFHGRHYRVQLIVYNFDDSSMAELRERPTTFHVTALNQRYDKGTCYANAGIHVYHGSNLEEAWANVRSWVMNPDLALPDYLLPFCPPEGR